jgi:ABC-type transport system involved in multi-copper enzyme maturation permease subunit
MTWEVIARQDWSVTVETRSAKVLLGLLAAVVLLAGYIYPVAAPEPITTARFSSFAMGGLTVAVPFVGMLLSYGAVVDERESGSILLSLSLPHSRRDVVLGKYLSRTGLVTAALVGSMLGAGALVVYPFGELVPGRFLAFLGLTALFGVVWSGLGLAVSLAAATRRRALVLGFGLVFLFVVVWDTAVRALTLGLNAAGLVDGELPAAVQFLVGLEPSRVFERVTTGFVLPGESVAGPWYLGEWVALVVLVLWVLGPLGLAYRRFDGSDLS